VEEEEDIFAFSGGEGMLDGLDDEGEDDDDRDWGVEEGGGAPAAAMSAARSSQDKVMSEEGSGAGSKMSRDSSSKDDNNKVDGGDASMARGGWSSTTDSGKEDDAAGCLADEEKNLYGSSLSLKASSTSKGFNAIVAMEANHQSLKESLSNAKACGGGVDDGKDTPEPVEEPGDEHPHQNQISLITLSLPSWCFCAQIIPGRCDHSSRCFISSFSLLRPFVAHGILSLVCHQAGALLNPAKRHCLPSTHPHRHHFSPLSYPLGHTSPPSPPPPPPLLVP
jgi:hypothetical protein